LTDAAVGPVACIQVGGSHRGQTAAAAAAAVAALRWHDGVRRGGGCGRRRRGGDAVADHAPGAAVGAVHPMMSVVDHPMIASPAELALPRTVSTG
jgi:hypothetical protein